MTGLDQSRTSSEDVRMSDDQSEAAQVPDVGRRDFLRTVTSGAAGAVAAAAVPVSAQTQSTAGAHGHDHQDVPSDPALRTKALESLLVEKGYVDPSTLDAF